MKNSVTFVKGRIRADHGRGGWTSWDERNMNGSLAASGVYLISAEMQDGHREFRKAALIK